MAESISDQTLIEQCLNGDNKSLETLVARYVKVVYNFALIYVRTSADAEDVVQETFLKVWKNLKKYNPEKNFKTWLLTIAKNASIDRLRKKRELPASYFDNEDDTASIMESIPDTEPLQGELLEKAMTKKTLSRALQKLSPTEREVLFLYYTEGLNFREIAETLNKSINTVKSRHRRAIISLRKILAP